MRWLGLYCLLDELSLQTWSSLEVCCLMLMRPGLRLVGGVCGMPTWTKMVPIELDRVVLFWPKRQMVELSPLVLIWLVLHGHEVSSLMPP